MTYLPRSTVVAIIGAAVLSTLSIGAAVGPARAATPSTTVGGSSNAASHLPDPVRM